VCNLLPLKCRSQSWRIRKTLPNKRPWELYNNCLLQFFISLIPLTEHEHRIWRVHNKAKDITLNFSKNTLKPIGKTDEEIPKTTANSMMTCIWNSDLTSMQTLYSNKKSQLTRKSLIFHINRDIQYFEQGKTYKYIGTEKMKVYNINKWKEYWKSNKAIHQEVKTEIEVWDKCEEQHYSNCSISHPTKKTRVLV
jgi:hypothetical protein